MENCERARCNKAHTDIVTLKVENKDWYTEETEEVRRSDKASRHAIQEIVIQETKAEEARYENAETRERSETPSYKNIEELLQSEEKTNLFKTEKQDALNQLTEEASVNETLRQRLTSVRGPY